MVTFTPGVSLIGPTHHWYPFIVSTTTGALYDVSTGQWWCGKDCVRRRGHPGAHRGEREPDWHHDPRAWQAEVARG